MGSATHILTTHHSGSPVVCWIINPISSRYMRLFMCQACLRFKPLTFRPSQIYSNIPNRAQSWSENHQAPVLHLELSLNVFQENNMLNYATKHATFPLKSCNLPVFVSFSPERQTGPGACNEWDGLLYDCKKTFWRERKKERLANRWGGSKLNQGSAPLTCSQTTKRTLQQRHHVRENSADCDVLLKSIIEFNE